MSAPPPGQDKVNVPINEVLAASLEHAIRMKDKNMDARHVAELPIEKQAEYADPITIKYANDAKFAGHDMMDSKELELNVNNLNATSLGNAAYLALNGHPDYREHNKILLQKIQELILARVMVDTGQDVCVVA
jgi:hypothetical protein